MPLFRSRAFMRKGSLGVTFFPSVCPSVRKFWEFHFLVNYNCDASYDHPWWPNGPEVNRKWARSFMKKCPQHTRILDHPCPSQSSDYQECLWRKLVWVNYCYCVYIYLQITTFLNGPLDKQILNNFKFNNEMMPYLNELDFRVLFISQKYNDVS